MFLIISLNYYNNWTDPFFKKNKANLFLYHLVTHTILLPFVIVLHRSQFQLKMAKESFLWDSTTKTNIFFISKTQCYFLDYVQNKYFYSQSITPSVIKNKVLEHLKFIPNYVTLGELTPSKSQSHAYLALVYH